MAVPEAPPTRQSVIDILRGLLADGIRFVRAEIRLVVAEGKDAAKRAAIGVALIVVALGFLFLVAIFGLSAGAIAVGDALDHPWLGFLIFAGGFLLITVLLGFLGYRRIKGAVAEGKGAFTTVKEDLEWVKQLPKRNGNES